MLRLYWYFRTCNRKNTNPARTLDATKFRFSKSERYSTISDRVVRSTVRPTLSVPHNRRPHQNGQQTVWKRQLTRRSPHERPRCVLFTRKLESKTNANILAAAFNDHVE